MVESMISKKDFDNLVKIYKEVELRVLREGFNKGEDLIDEIIDGFLRLHNFTDNVLVRAKIKQEKFSHRLVEKTDKVYELCRELVAMYER